MRHGSLRTRYLYSLVHDCFASRSSKALKQGVQCTADVTTGIPGTKIRSTCPTPYKSKSSPRSFGGEAPSHYVVEGMCFISKSPGRSWGWHSATSKDQFLQGVYQLTFVFKGKVLQTRLQHSQGLHTKYLRIWFKNSLKVWVLRPETANTGYLDPLGSRLGPGLDLAG